MSPSSLPPLFYLPLSSSHTAPSDTHKHTNYLVVKVLPLFVFVNLVGPTPSHTIYSYIAISEICHFYFSAVGDDGSVLFFVACPKSIK